MSIVFFFQRCSGVAVTALCFIWWKLESARFRFGDGSWVFFFLVPSGIASMILVKELKLSNDANWANYNDLSRGHLQLWLAKESPQNLLNSGLGIIVICPDAKLCSS